MGVILNGIGVGFLSALLLSIYLSGLFNFVVPLWLIYGILAPFISAIAIIAGVYSKKENRKKFEVYWPEKEKSE